MVFDEEPTILIPSAFGGASVPVGSVPISFPVTRFEPPPSSTIPAPENPEMIIPRTTLAPPERTRPSHCPGLRAVDLDQVRSGVSRLTGAVDDDGVGDLGQRAGQRDELDARAGQIERDRARAESELTSAIAHRRVPTPPSSPRTLHRPGRQQDARLHRLHAGQPGPTTGCEGKTIPAMSESKHAMLALDCRSL